MRGSQDKQGGSLGKKALVFSGIAVPAPFCPLKTPLYNKPDAYQTMAKENSRYSSSHASANVKGKSLASIVWVCSPWTFSAFAAIGYVATIGVYRQYLSVSRYCRFQDSVFLVSKSGAVPVSQMASSTSSGCAML